MTKSLKSRGVLHKKRLLHYRSLYKMVSASDGRRKICVADFSRRRNETRLLEPAERREQKSKSELTEPSGSKPDIK